MKFVFWLSMLAIAGCATRTPVPVTERAPLPARPPAAAAPESPVPPATVLAPAPVEPEVPTYVVRRGDTLGKIAADNAISSRDLAAWNNIDNPHLLRPGQVLRLRPPTASDASLAASPTPLAGADGSGVLTAPLRTPPPVVESPAGGVPSRSTGAMPSGGSAPAAAPSRALAEGLKTEPKGIRLPYSEQAVAQLQRGAAPGSASPDTGRARAPASTPAPATPAVPLAALASPPTQAAASPSLPTPVKPVVPAPAPGSAPPPASPAPATASAAPGASAATPSAALANEEDSIDWIWPTSGKVLSGFSEGANTKGIDIAGRPGQPVVAVADGRVVYAGSGLRGYGKLIIIKHNKTYISAYAHNSQIHVKEGQQVTRGQRIADMGDSDADQVKLHFEIRRMGKPVDPSRYLPPG